MQMPRIALAVAMCCSLFILGCDRAAELIPGERSGVPGAPSLDATPTPVVAPPIVAPGSIRPVGAQGEGGPALADAELVRSVVQLQLLADGGDAVTVVRNGSGVVVDAGGRLILTSYVLVDPFDRDGGPAYSTIAVGVTGAAGGEPELTFEAELLDGDPATDLAVLRVVRRYGGGALRGGDFDLPAVQLGDDRPLEQGDALRLFGHPGLPLDDVEAAPSQAVVTTAASVLGFRGSAHLTGRAWLKTDGRLPYGCAGGPAFDETGALVGVTTQIAYDPRAQVGQVRPISLARDVLARARAAGPEATYVAPLQRSAALSEDGEERLTIESPAFAENAVEGGGTLDLFDYTWRIDSRPAGIYYEYAGQGVPEGAVVEERWYLDDLLQDALSSSYNWSLGSFGVVGDKLMAPSGSGIPAGEWRLEVWVDGVQRAAGTVFVATEPSLQPRVSGFAFGSRADDLAVASPPSGEVRQLLAFFDYADAGASRQLRWVVFRDGNVVYQSPVMPWRGGEDGRWWVGFARSKPLGPGLWEIEVYLDGPGQRQPISRGADGVQLS